ncbi:MAG: sigma-70 family RNA polymerase sigma factor [Planctomycetes bacterium]|nr:sigma-70 family RNA polymerase sigma factor [Planctomycetota bacterium]
MTSPATPPGSARFRTTRWSLVVAAGAAEGTEGRAALETLCRDCWFPLYAFARRGGAAPADAADLVQGFFADLLEREGIAAADPARGRFRTFLLAAFRHFASKERERARALKRGGGAVLPLDFSDGESRYLAEPADDRTPERIYERRWALALLDRVLADLRADYAGERAVLFETLGPWLAAAGDPPSHAEAAARLGLSEGAVRVALHRLRRRYRDLLRGAIAETVGSPEEVDDEIRHLLEALA